MRPCESSTWSRSVRVTLPVHTGRTDGSAVHTCSPSRGSRAAGVIEIATMETVSLGDRSYLAHDGVVAVVIDPQRDIDRVLGLGTEHGVRITHVLETHVHNDYVSGGLELAGSMGAVYTLPAGSGVEFEHAAVGDGELLVVGRMRLRVLHTPGHTLNRPGFARGWG